MQQAELIPPVVYLACAVAGTESFTPDLRTTEDGRVALLVYSALDRLVDRCGPGQPWVVVQTAKLDAIDAYAPHDVVLLDAEIPDEHRRAVAAP